MFFNNTEIKPRQPAMQAGFAGGILKADFLRV